jgi:hypothetical protein
MNRQHQEPDSLVNMRTHLTVAMLAVTLLRRRHDEDEDVLRLCASAETALWQLNEDIVGVEAVQARDESRDASWRAHRRLRHALATAPSRQHIA